MGAHNCSGGFALRHACHASPFSCPANFELCKRRAQRATLEKQALLEAAGLAAFAPKLAEVCARSGTSGPVGPFQLSSLSDGDLLAEDAVGMKRMHLVKVSRSRESCQGFGCAAAATYYPRRRLVTCVGIDRQGCVRLYSCAIAKQSLSLVSAGLCDCVPQLRRAILEFNDAAPLSPQPSVAFVEESTAAPSSSPPPQISPPPPPPPGAIAASLAVMPPQAPPPAVATASPPVPPPAEAPVETAAVVAASFATSPHSPVVPAALVSAAQTGAHALAYQVSARAAVVGRSLFQ